MNENVETLNMAEIIEPKKEYTEKLNLKFTLTKVDEIETAKGKIPLENCLSDTTISGIVLFIQKGLIDDNGIHGVSRNVAMSVVEKYLEKKDKDDLILDITEALIDGGFLSRELDITTLREKKLKQSQEMKDKLNHL